MSDEPQENTPVFDPDAPNQQKPKIRPLRAVPMPMQTQEGQQVVMMGLADSQQVMPKMVVTHPAFQKVLPLMDGSKGVEEIVSQVEGLDQNTLERFVAQLDQAGLIFGPVFDKALEEMHENFDNTDTLPPGSTAQIADLLVMQEHGEDASDEVKQEHGPAALKAAMDQWIDASLKDAVNPSFDTLPKAIIAPHLDYPRGWLNYGNTYGRLRVAERPDRVIILGTNHFGRSTGVCGCNKGYETPLGVCEADVELIDALKAELGGVAETLFAERYDHENEHSVELHIPWIQHVFGADDAGNYPKVFGALIHDPLVNNGASYDGNGVDLDPFVEALDKTLSSLGGTTLIVSSADLSHVGPAFGDQQAMAGDEEPATQRRSEVAKHDQETLKAFVEQRLDDMVGAMSWQQNPTRWCSVGNMTAAMRLAKPEKVDLLNYSAAMDPQGNAMVTSAAIAMF